MKEITSQRCDIYFVSDKDAYLLHNMLLGEYANESFFEHDLNKYKLHFNKQKCSLYLFGSLSYS